MTPARLLLAPAATAGVVLLSGCGGAANSTQGTTTANGTPETTTSVTAAPSEPGGPVAGRITSVSAGGIIVQRQSGLGRVSFTPSTVFLRESPGTRADLVAGSCVVARGRKQGARLVAVFVTLSAPGASGCAAARDGGGEPPGRPDAGGGQHQGTQPERQPTNEAFASGTVSATNGGALTLTRPRVTVLISKTTRIVAMTRASRRAAAVGSCVLVRGSADKTGAVTAATVTLTRPVTGGCAGEGGFGAGEGAGHGAGAGESGSGEGGSETN